MLGVKAKTGGFATGLYVWSGSPNPDSTGAVPAAEDHIAMATDTKRRKRRTAPAGIAPAERERCAGAHDKRIGPINVTEARQVHSLR